MQPLQFVPFSSAPEVGFWRELGRRKLDELGLDDAPIPVCARFEVTEHGRSACLASVDGSAFGAADDLRRGAPAGTHAMIGVLVNTNTLDEFKRADKNALMERAAVELRAELTRVSPTRLTRIIVLTHADLKSHEYYYWFGFPALAPAVPIVASEPAPLDDALAPLAVDALRAAYESAGARGAGAGAGPAPGASAADGEGAATDGLSFFVVRVRARARARPPTVATRDERDGVGSEVEVATLGRWSAWCREAEADEDLAAPMLAFADPVAHGPHPGWPLRNLLIWARAQPHTPQDVDVICWREAPRAVAGGASRTAGGGGGGGKCRSLLLRARLRADEASGVSTTSQPVAVGWERNARGRLGARLVSMRSQLDPKALAEASVDLNLRLMRWRLLPELQTERLAALRCLLIGAGTLGCNVARALMGWGVRDITFVDGGAVSHSNPVRQSLFTYADCVAPERRAKALAAADAVNGIFPGARASGYELVVPMPGHPVANGELDAVRAAVARLEELVDAHDAVFLLTDTRESRWLPALLCAAKDKLAITAALGFDSFVVMRHGSGPAPAPAPAPATAPARADGACAQADAKAADEVVMQVTAKAAVERAAKSAAGTPRADVGSSGTRPRLGCYFCNDVVAPVNSTLDRTLDQQCTVTRPGLSMVASALAVELLVSLAHHPLAHGAPADAHAAEPSTPLGLVPHQLRGFLPTFRTDLLTGEAFSCCVACSERVVVDGYRADGFAFLLRAFNEPDFLEIFSGLRELHKQAEAAIEAWEGDGGDDELGEDF